MKIKSLELEFFTGFESAKFDFYRSNGSRKPICAFYGPNGCGKSTALEAIRMLGNILMYSERANDLLLRKLIYHPNYDPTLPHFMTSDNDMRMAATFVDDEGNELRNEITSKGVTEDGEFDGILSMEAPDMYSSYFVDADNQINTQKFQLPDINKDIFLDMARIVYGYEPSLGKEIWTIEGDVKVLYWQDLVIKKGKTLVHYKSMSAGEKKVATLLRSICNPYSTRDSKVLLVDNIEMHVYFERHGKMLDIILDSFPDTQFVITTHSGDMLRHIAAKYGKDCLFNVPDIKGEPMNDISII